MKNALSTCCAVAALSFALPTLVHGQSITQVMLDSARVEIDRAVDRADSRLLADAKARLERVAAVAPNDPWVHHYLGYAHYRDAIFRIQQNADNKAVLAAARAELERSIALRPLPESHALLASVLGQMIGSNPIKGMSLGPKSDDEMEKALKLGPENPRVWLLNGIGTLHKPAMFGGGIDKAATQLNKAVQLFNLDKPSGSAPTWGRVEVYAWLGQIEVKRNNLAAARQMYQRALALDPEYGWVKYVLLPALDEKGR